MRLPESFSLFGQKYEKWRLKDVSFLALPIVGGMVSQNLLNLVDTFMVGKLGDASLAAIGIGGFVLFLSQAVLTGLSVGVQALASRRIGEGKQSEAGHSLTQALILGLIFGLPLFFLLQSISPIFYQFLLEDEEVRNLSLSYYQIRLLGMLFVGWNFSYRGFWNGIKKSHIYFMVLIITHLTNIILNYLLIFGKAGFPEMGLEGAAWASMISMVVGFSIHSLFGLKVGRAYGLFKLKLKTFELKALIKISLPYSIQQLFFSAGFTAMFWIIGKTGTHELAAAHVLIAVILLAILPGIGIGLAGTTYVGQSLGEKRPEEAKVWTSHVVLTSLIFFILISLPLLFFPESIFSVFISNPKTLALTIAPARISGALLFMDAFGLAYMHALLGAGDSTRSMKISLITQWLIFLPIAYLLGPVLGYGLTAIWAAFVGYRVLQGIWFWRLWRRGDWSIQL